MTGRSSWRVAAPGTAGATGSVLLCCAGESLLHAQKSWFNALQLRDETGPHVVCEVTPHSGVLRAVKGVKFGYTGVFTALRCA